jgi:hypothetical protein
MYLVVTSLHILDDNSTFISLFPHRAVCVLGSSKSYTGWFTESQHPEFQWFPFHRSQDSQIGQEILLVSHFYIALYLSLGCKTPSVINMLQTTKSRVHFPMKPLDISVDLALSASLWPYASNGSENQEFSCG